MKKGCCISICELAHDTRAQGERFALKEIRAISIDGKIFKGQIIQPRVKLAISFDDIHMQRRDSQLYTTEASLLTLKTLNDSGIFHFSSAQRSPPRRPLASALLRKI